ncbi:MAG: hypothetical protein EOO27_27445 [Comamonadaceae bacterium]|nr:MAG: hypothetical protein EOO27_27445 [Comamonadaceae bacterium]
MGHRRLRPLLLHPRRCPDTARISPQRSRPRPSTGPHTERHTHRISPGPLVLDSTGAHKHQIVGIPGKQDGSVVHGNPPNGKFSVLRFRDGALTCVESLNSPAVHIESRKIVALPARPTREDIAIENFDLRRLELIIEGRQETPLDTALNRQLERRKPAYAPESQFLSEEHRRVQVHHHESPPHCPYLWSTRTFDENLGSQHLDETRSNLDYRPPTPGFGRTGRSSARRFAAARAAFNWR